MLPANHQSLSYFQASFGEKMAGKDQGDVLVVDEHKETLISEYEAGPCLLDTIIALCGDVWFNSV